MIVAIFMLLKNIKDENDILGIIFKHNIVQALSCLLLFTGCATLQKSQNPYVAIRQTALSGSDPCNGFFTIVVSDGKRDLAKYPTEGYLLDDFKSPSGKYIAVNNRRANSGDYLWVFRLSDGFAIKIPIDAGPEGSRERYEDHFGSLLERVRSNYPDLVNKKFSKLFTFAHGWTKTNELQVKTNMAFRYLENKVVVVWDTFKIENGKLILLNENIEISPWPLPETQGGLNAKSAQ